MKRLTIITLALLSLNIMTAAKTNKTVTLRIIETSDVHGAFFPYDFIERRPMNGTMARVSTYLKRQRQKFGNRLILLDNGDILQGQPTCYYSNYVKTDLPNVAAEVINYLKYDAEVFGNHDIETGHIVYDKWIRELNCPTLGANIIDTKSGKPYVEPYLMLEIRDADTSHPQLVASEFVVRYAIRRDGKLCPQVGEDATRTRKSRYCHRTLS